jgi:phage repressor protein C with HTH and peptisase S24 domain
MFRENTGLTQAELAEAIEMSRAIIAKVEATGGQPSRNLLLKLRSAFGLNPDWVLTGDGEMLVPQRPLRPRGGQVQRIEQVDEERPGHGDVSIDGEDFSFIRRYRVNLSAGVGLILDGEPLVGAMAFSTAWLARQGINEDLSGIVSVNGDSMTPTIPDGALVLVHAGERRVEREGIFAFSRDGEAFVKRLIPVDSWPDGRAKRIVIVSDNPTLPSETIEGEALNALNIAGRVRCVIKAI